mmetsp:Transcript_31743/g.55161  ORF Transcript_31743/g.55161 Transcript_31743/m.55161 type:complete len:225 (+) Transcript_31743:378-1052(+)
MRRCRAPKRCARPSPASPSTACPVAWSRPASASAARPGMATSVTPMPAPTRPCSRPSAVVATRCVPATPKTDGLADLQATASAHRDPAVGLFRAAAGAATAAGRADRRASAPGADAAGARVGRAAAAGRSVRRGGGRWRAAGPAGGARRAAASGSCQGQCPGDCRRQLCAPHCHPGARRAEPVVRGHELAGRRGRGPAAPAARHGPHRRTDAAGAAQPLHCRGG